MPSRPVANCTSSLSASVVLVWAQQGGGQGWRGSRGSVGALVEWLGGPHIHPSIHPCVCLSLPSFIHSANVCLAPIMSLTCVGGGYVRYPSPSCPALSPARPVSSQAPHPVGCSLQCPPSPQSLRGRRGVTVVAYWVWGLQLTRFRACPPPAPRVPSTPMQNAMVPCNCTDKAWPPWPSVPCCARQRGWGCFPTFPLCPR